MTECWLGLPILLSGQFYIGLILALLVLQRAVQEHDAGVLDASPHAAGQHDILLEHHTIQDLAVVQRASRKLLYFGVLLDVYLGFCSIVSDFHPQDSVESQILHRNRILHCLAKHVQLAARLCAQTSLL